MSRGWIGGLSLRFIILGTAIFLTMRAGANPVALLIGLSIVLFVLLTTVVVIISARRADQEPIEEAIEAEILDAEESPSG
ncbi:MAG TPA: hypothetical protein EYQ80_02595 [Candidatus Poseidoniales archaeon]|nr:hypothetical protein [Candidatus Poseidoniales archaeon]